MKHVISKFAGKKKAFLEKIIGELEPRALGCSEGQAWDRDLPNDAKFEEYFAQAKETVIGPRNEGHLVKWQTDQLHEDSRSTNKLDVLHALATSLEVFVSQSRVVRSVPIQGHLVVSHRSWVPLVVALPVKITYPA